MVTGGTLTLKRSGKSCRTRLVDPRSVHFLAQIAPKRWIWNQKSQKLFPGGIPRTPSARGGDPLPHPTPSTATRRARGRKLPRCWMLGRRSRKPLPQLKIYHYTPASDTCFLITFGTFHTLLISVCVVLAMRPCVATGFVSVRPLSVMILRRPIKQPTQRRRALYSVLPAPSSVAIRAI